MSTTAEPLRALLDRAHEQHADTPQAFAKALAARADGLKPDAEGAEAIRWAEHVMVGHLADAGALQAFIDAVPAALAQAEPTLPCLQSARRCIALMRGDAAADAPPRLRWRSLHNAALGLALTGRAHEACVHAQRAAGDLAAARSHREQMAAWLPQVADESLRDWCARTLESTPA